MQSKRLFKSGPIMMVLTIFLAINATASLTGGVIIQNSGNISAHTVTAQSGSPQDIQAAVYLMTSVGGGTVYVPAGNFTFDIDYNNNWTINGLPCGVIVPGGVSIIGAGGWSPYSPYDSDPTQGNISTCQTILRETKNPPLWAGTYSGCPMFLLDGYNGKPIRISGIYFQGFCDNEKYGGEAIRVYPTVNFRIDHCDFTNFGDEAIFSSTNYRMSYLERGVIDHCNIDNPYKNNLTMGDYTHRLWGYGVGCERDDYSWTNNTASVIGHYDDDPCVVYIENCNFRRCRHETAANGGAHYVSRYNTFTEVMISWYGGYNDAHGSSGNPPGVGTRAVEIYDNTFIDVATDYRSTDQQWAWGQYLGAGIGIRGGAAVIFNNTFYDTNIAVSLISDASWTQCMPHDIWIWGNTYNSTRRIAVGQGAMTQLNVGTTNQGYTYNLTSGLDYSTATPTQSGSSYILPQLLGEAQITYTPYTYPHPLTLSP